MYISSQTISSQSSEFIHFYDRRQERWDFSMTWGTNLSASMEKKSKRRWSLLCFVLTKAGHDQNLRTGENWRGTVKYCELMNHLSLYSQCRPKCLMQMRTVLKHERIGRLFNSLQVLIELAQCDNWFTVLGVWVPSTLALFLSTPDPVASAARGSQKGYWSRR